MKNLYRISTIFFVSALMLATGCGPGITIGDHQFAAYSENNSETITGTFLHNENGKGEITIDAKTSEDDACSGKAYIAWNFRVWWGKKGTFNLSCENDLNITGTFEVVTKNPNHGYGEGQDLQGNKYNLVFTFKHNK